LYRVVGVRFKPAGKIYYFDPAGSEFGVHANVIVETSHGVEFGTVVLPSKDVKERDIVQPLRKIIRTATNDDYARMKRNSVEAVQDLASLTDRFKQLKMKLLQIEYTFDRSKMYFYYTAEGRVDFRELVKYLVSVYRRTRVELRQVGVRDEAKLLGGIGPCGRILCCSTFLGEFEPVSIKMAKDQKLSLNPVKLSGLCGRLMCCLRFETHNYESGKSGFPSPGGTITTAYGQVKVVSVHPETNKIVVQSPSRPAPIELDLDDPEISW